MSGFSIVESLHNKRESGASRETRPVIFRTGTPGRFNIYKSAMEVLGITSEDLVGIIIAKDDEGNLNGYIFQGDAGTKDEKGKVLNKAIGSQLTPAHNSDNISTFSMSLAHTRLGELFSENFTATKKGGIYFTISEEEVEVVPTYEKMENVKMFKMIPVTPEEEQEEEEEEVDVDSTSAQSESPIASL